MWFLECIEVVVTVLFILFAVTQVFIPFFRGTAFFPLFRPEAKLSAKLADVRQKKVERGLEEQIQKEENSINKESGHEPK